MKTSELTGAQLDWAVAKCENEEYSATATTNGIGMEFPATDYSIDWAQGGPIIEREGISVIHSQNGSNYFWSGEVFESTWLIQQSGPTALIAAMRCYVASELGDDVEIPKELA